jgi:lipopolysaccharide transport system ATP-binding protein
MILILTGIGRTASTWLEAIFLAVRERYGLGWVPRGLENYLADLDACGLKDGHIYAGVFLSWEGLGLEKVRSPRRILHVRRDPRDVLVSVYFSLKLSHSARPEHEDWQEKLQTLSEEDGLLLLTEEENLLPLWIPILDSYREKGETEGCLALEFAEIVTNPYLHVKSYLESAGLDVDTQWLRDTLEARSFERLSGGRMPGQENVRHHYRKGTTGDWRNHFTPRVKERFRENYGPALVRLGYEKDLDW